MTSTAETTISFVRLTEVDVADVSRLLNEPRNRRHMPLAAPMSDDAVARWVRDKDVQWDANGYGPWAVLIDGRFAGWGGYQDEDGDADFALVLEPASWGCGERVTRMALERGFADLGLDSVTIALPYSRRPDRVVARFGFTPDGEVEHGGTLFRRYRLRRDEWRSVTRRY